MGPPTGYRGRRTAAENLAEDDHLLRAAEPAVRVALIADRYLSLGISQRVDAPAALRASALGVPVLHRSSGGTGVLQLPGDIAWAIVLPRSHPLVGRGYTRAFGQLGAPVVEVLERVGVNAQWRPSPGLSEEFCLLGPRGESLFGGDAAIGGAAQHLTGTALLHHGILNVEIDRRLIVELFRLSPAAVACVSGLRELGVSASSEELGERLAASLGGLLGFHAAATTR